jgi:hypothetical protein
MKGASMTIDQQVEELLNLFTRHTVFDEFLH